MIDHVEAHRVDGALADGLRNEEEVMPSFDGDAPVDDGAGRGVGVLPGGPCCNSEERQTFVMDKKEDIIQQQLFCSLLGLPAFTPASQEIPRGYYTVNKDKSFSFE